GEVGYGLARGLPRLRSPCLQLMSGRRGQAADTIAIYVRAWTIADAPAHATGRLGDGPQPRGRRPLARRCRAAEASPSRGNDGSRWGRSSPSLARLMTGFSCSDPPI